MPTPTELTDEYLAALLRREAKSSKHRTDRPKDAPKPNLRFLRNLMKETDSHNSELIEKERRAAEAKSYQHMHGEGRPNKRFKAEKPDRWSTALKQQGLTSRTLNEDRQSKARSDKEHHSTSESSKSRHGRRRSEEPSRHDRRRSKERSNSPKPAVSKRSRDDLDTRLESRKRYRQRRDEHSRSPARRKHRDHRSRKTDTQLEHDASSTDSDPLEAIVGPRQAPKLTPRGRGTTADESGINARFNDVTYDPRNDKQDDDDDDWNMALSALHDRQKWQTSGADRLRSAGFDEEAISKWKASTRLPKKDKDIDDVVWTAKGGTREWDRGKVVLSDGAIKSGPRWLKAED